MINHDVNSLIIKDRYPQATTATRRPLLSAMLPLFPLKLLLPDFLKAEA